ncbi:unnamed protein product [Arctia plantaginis]|uniref:Metallo-beta-lactamase domain-containing protein n=1 Tax=Arctia plantaginis TaxID=874455 RepID=A0A8S1AI00_ARCPL|nr:unnamed protein product [Arctia plantaginis]
MNDDDINAYLPSLLNPRRIRKQYGELSLTQNSIASRCSLSLRRSHAFKLSSKPKVHPLNKENLKNIQNQIPCTASAKCKKQSVDRDSLGFSAIEDLHSVTNYLDGVSLGVVEGDVPTVTEKVQIDNAKADTKVSLRSVSSNTDLDKTYDKKSDSTVIYNIDERPIITLSFGVNQCQSVEITSKNSNFKRVLVTQNNDNTIVDCDILESSKISSESDMEEENDEPLPNTPKRSAVTVNLEIKKTKTSPETAENSKVLILNTSAVEKISHVIVQPPNYKLVKGNFINHSKIKSVSKRKKTVLDSDVSNGIVRGLRQKSIDSFFSKRSKVSEEDCPVGLESVKVGVIKNGDSGEMSKNSGVADKSGRKSPFFGGQDNASSRQGTASSARKASSPRPDTANSLPRGGALTPNSLTPRKNVDTIQFNLSNKSQSTKRATSTKVIPSHKIVAGTHFAVDAFSYGDIPNVKHYFLTHFHSDHYSGLKKGFNKSLYCTKITADLCISRLGVPPKCIHVLKIDETIRVEGVEVTAVEANHCPGAVMLVFTLPNGKTLLHTGDFRASPAMESYPIFWNKDIHTIYLDTTYCNPRYDFPTQEQSLEMALYILRQKKQSLEKAGKKFSSVLIVCGTYTIGKEKFFLGMSRRVGCAVWACPEKDRVLQAVEGRSFSHAPPHSCQLHVVPMRDLTHEKLRAYLDSLKGAFSELVAFKPSGWENGKSACVEKDMVAIHGIPYSEHSSFSEMIRFVKFLKPKQVVPTVDISGGIGAVQKYFPCPLVHKEEMQAQSKVTDFFSIQKQQQVPAVT